jgi:hypothetical protein
MVFVSQFIVKTDALPAVSNVHIVQRLCEMSAFPYKLYQQQGPMYKFKGNHSPEVENPNQQHCFDFVLRHPWLLWPGDSP